MLSYVFMHANVFYLRAFCDPLAINFCAAAMTAVKLTLRVVFFLSIFVAISSYCGSSRLITSNSLLPKKAVKKTLAVDAILSISRYCASSSALFSGAILFIFLSSSLALSCQNITISAVYSGLNIDVTCPSLERYSFSSSVKSMTIGKARRSYDSSRRNCITSYIQLSL